MKTLFELKSDHKVGTKHEDKNYHLTNHFISKSQVYHW